MYMSPILHGHANLNLRRLASIRRFLTTTATATLVSVFALSWIDYCFSLLFRSTHDVTSHLQRTQNCAGGVILPHPMSSIITTHLKSLHWLPFMERSTYKIHCLCYNCKQQCCAIICRWHSAEKAITLPQQPL